MKVLLFFSFGLLLSFTSAKPQQYGVPQFQEQQQQYGAPLGNNVISGGDFSSQSSSGGGSLEGPKVYKHISIHVPPSEEFETPMKRIIRPVLNSDKIVNIIFVKAPSQSTNQQTEVILPSQPESKTVVYILVKRPEPGQNEVKIRQPAPTRPPRPEVFFIKYSKNKTGGGGGGSQESGSSEGLLGGGVDEGGSSGVDSRPEYGVPA